MSAITTNQVLSKAIELFKQEGINRFSMEDIANKLYVPLAQLKNIASAKEDLVRKAMLYDMEQEREIQKKLIQTSRNAIEEIMGLLVHGIKNSSKLNMQYLTDAVSMPMVWELLNNEIENYSIPIYKEILNRGVLQGIFRSDINVDIVTRLIMEYIKVLYNFQVFPPERYSPTEVARSIYLYYFRGICKQEQAYLVDNYFAMNIYK